MGIISSIATYRLTLGPPKFVKIVFGRNFIEIFGDKLENLKI